MRPEPAPCPRCGGPVTINASGGGRGTGDLTFYMAACRKCDFAEDHFGQTGRHDDAVRQYNRWVKDCGASVAADTGYKNSDARERSKFGTAGVVCAPVGIVSPVGEAKRDLPVDQAFAADIAADVQFADALTRHVTGHHKIRRATAIKTLQAISALSYDDLSYLLNWARQQSS